jgi:diguanylate cyclase (GGDEF)-like protein
VSAARSSRLALLGAALVSYAAVFAGFILFEVPGRGIGHFYYFPIALVALASGPFVGAAAGALAAALWSTGVLIAPSLPYTQFPVLSTAIRLLVFSAVGALIGTYAARNRTLLEELARLAERDQLTGLPNTRAFEAAISRRLELGRPFALLVGDTKQIDDAPSPTEGADALRRLAERLTAALRPDDEIARLGATSFAVLSACEDVDEAARVAARIERVVSADGPQITFGWSVHPQDGDNALSLYRAADERMYARKLIRDRTRAGSPTPRDLYAPPLAPVASDGR